MVRKVIVGVAGGGKTSYGMDIIERELRNGVRWSQIGFSSFSRAACAEAAERAGRLLNEDPARLQKTGFFRTIHSAALRCLGVDTAAIVDHDTVEGKKFLKDACGSDRNGEPGTQAGKLNEALTAWDTYRAKLVGIDEELVRFENGQLAQSCVFGESGEVRHPGHPGHPRTPSVSEGVALEVVAAFDVALTPDTLPPIPIGTFLEKYNATPSAKSEKGCPGVRAEYNPIGHKDLQRDTLRVGGCPRVSRVSVQWAIQNLLSKISKHERLIQRYERHKKLYGRIDYTDILLLYSGIAADDGLRLVQGYPAGQVPEEVHVWMFDEYQDCSPLLARTAQRLSEAAADVFLLGDGYQAIYGFSGASTAVFRAEEVRAKELGNRIVLNRTWRNTDSVIEWGESVLSEDSEYESRNPFGEAGEGSTGLLDRQKFEQILPSLAGTDTLIISRAWFSLDPIKAKLDDLAIPWRSCQEDKASRWSCHAKIAFTLVMRELTAGDMISEQDWRRVTTELPMKWNSIELFNRGTKAKWKKMQCSGEPKITLEELHQWGATAGFISFVKEGRWRKDMPLLLDRAIDLHGVDEVRKPSIRLGSVHSVKGLEARNVFCLADSTLKVTNECDPSEERCLKYVAITRASMHYRLVVNRLDISRGKPLFWAAPQGEKTYVEFNDPGVKRTTQSDQMVPTETHQGPEVSSLDLRHDRDGGSDPLREWPVCRDRNESRRTTADADADPESAGDQDEWRNL